MRTHFETPRNVADGVVVVHLVIVQLLHIIRVTRQKRYRA